MNVRWMMVLAVLAVEAGCAPNYFSVGLPLGGSVGQRGAPLDPKTLAPCQTANAEAASACVYYVNACDTKGIHTLQIQRVKKELVVTAYCVEPNAVVPPPATLTEATSPPTPIKTAPLTPSSTDPGAL